MFPRYVTVEGSRKYFLMLGIALGLVSAFTPIAARADTITAEAIPPVVKLDPGIWEITHFNGFSISGPINPGARVWAGLRVTNGTDSDLFYGGSFGSSGDGSCTLDFFLGNTDYYVCGEAPGAGPGSIPPVQQWISTSGSSMPRPKLPADSAGKVNWACSFRRARPHSESRLLIQE